MQASQIVEKDGHLVVITDHNGTKRYLNQYGQLHRDGDLPAVVAKDEVFYYQNGILHRDNGPAVISQGQEIYYHYGALHREGNLPAKIVYSIGSDKKVMVCQEYYLNDTYHRENGPAILWNTGSYAYYRHGQRHNEAGPACHWVHSDGVVDEYWLYGEKVSPLLHKIYAMKNNVFFSRIAQPNKIKSL